MNIIYTYLQSKTIEKIFSKVYDKIIGKDIENTYTIITDPYWAEEYQKSLLGKVIIKTQKEEVEEVKIYEKKEKQTKNVETQTENK